MNATRIEFNTIQQRLYIDGASRAFTNKTFIPAEFRAHFPQADIYINGVLIYIPKA
jgi:hypothetical protein